MYHHYDYHNDEPTTMEFVEDRPGHDLRYSLDSSKLILDEVKPRNDGEPVGSKVFGRAVIGQGSMIQENNDRPVGNRFVVGDNSEIML